MFIQHTVNACLPKQFWQEITTASLHDDSPSRKDEADLCLFVRNADGQWQGHCDPHSDCTALNGAYRRFPTAMDCERYPAASIPMFSKGFFVMCEADVLCIT